MLKKVLFLILCLIFNNILPGNGASSQKNIDNRQKRISKRHSSADDQENDHIIKITCESPLITLEFASSFLTYINNLFDDFLLIGPKPNESIFKICFYEISLNEIKKTFKDFAKERNSFHYKLNVEYAKSGKQDIVDIHIFNLFKKVIVRCENNEKLQKFLKESDPLKKLNDYTIEKLEDSQASLIFEKPLTSKGLHNLFRTMKNIDVKNEIIGSELNIFIKYNKEHE